MSAVITGIVATTAPLLLLGLAAVWRWRLVGAMVVAVAAIAAAVALGIVAPSDLWVVPMGLGMGESLILVLLWTAFGAVARTAGPLRVPGPPWLVAVAMGAGLGEIPAAAILSAGASSPKAAARLALAAAGGAMIGRVGDPAMLLLTGGHPTLVAALIPLGLAMAMVARPQAEDLVASIPGNQARTAVVACVVAAGLVPMLTPWALLVGMLALGLLAQDRRGHVDLAHVGWQLIAVLVGVLAIVGGAADQAAFGLEWGVELADWMGPPVLVAAAALLTAMTDATAMAMVAVGIVDRALSLDTMSILPGLTAGIAVGGLAPLIAAGSVRAGLKIWLLQVVLAVAWATAWALL
jgi:hypothetical protein